MATIADPADGADQFKATEEPTPTHRSGYGSDRLTRLCDWLRRHPHGTLASGEGFLLLEALDKCRAELAEAQKTINMMRGGIT